MPTNSPLVFTSGPPLFPGLMGASVWMYTDGTSGSAWRATALTTPLLTAFSRPSRPRKGGRDADDARVGRRAVFAEAEAGADLRIAGGGWSEDDANALCAFHDVRVG